MTEDTKAPKTIQELAAERKAARANSSKKTTKRKPRGPNKPKTITTEDKVEQVKEVCPAINPENAMENLKWVNDINVTPSPEELFANGILEEYPTQVEEFMQENNPESVLGEPQEHDQSLTHPTLPETEGNVSTGPTEPLESIPSGEVKLASTNLTEIMQMFINLVNIGGTLKPKTMPQLMRVPFEVLVDVPSPSAQDKKELQVGVEYHKVVVVGNDRIKFFEMVQEMVKNGAYMAPKTLFSTSPTNMVTLLCTSEPKTSPYVRYYGKVVA